MILDNKNLAPIKIKVNRGAADPMLYPINPTIPAQVPVSAGENNIQAPKPEATRVAVASQPPALFREII